jgi:hypothetical protein
MSIGQQTRTGTFDEPTDEQWFGVTVNRRDHNGDPLVLNLSGGWTIAHLSCAVRSDQIADYSIDDQPLYRRRYTLMGEDGEMISLDRHWLHQFLRSDCTLAEWLSTMDDNRYALDHTWPIVTYDREWALWSYETNDRWVQMLPESRVLHARTSDTPGSAPDGTPWALVSTGGDTPRLTTDTIELQNARTRPNTQVIDITLR